MREVLMHHQRDKPKNEGKGKNEGSPPEVGFVGYDYHVTC